MWWWRWSVGRTASTRPGWPRPRACRAPRSTGFPIGGVPPFGHPRPVVTYVDEDLLAFDVVWAAAGTPRHVFALRPDDLVRVTGGVVSELREA
jgi:prolyl-tRNA editing enzyme YbaK/EbsC (Cys-tRNA(Pro) deacylase)